MVSKMVAEYRIEARKELGNSNIDPQIKITYVIWKRKLFRFGLRSPWSLRGQYVDKINEHSVFEPFVFTTKDKAEKFLAELKLQ